jgi:hypothetical protein
LLWWAVRHELDRMQAYVTPMWLCALLKFSVFFFSPGRGGASGFPVEPSGSFAWFPVVVTRLRN